MLVYKCDVCVKEFVSRPIFGGNYLVLYGSFSDVCAPRLIKELRKVYGYK